jgi:hypothetical protein
MFLVPLALLLATATPPDVRLDWINAADVITGEAGATIEMRYSVRNVGGAPAFAVVLRNVTSLGPLGEPLRVQPGPEPGKKMDRVLSFALAPGMRELCVEATLQNRNLDDPLDPTPSNNRICRVVRVTERKTPPRAKGSGEAQ